MASSLQYILHVVIIPHSVIAGPEHIINIVEMNRVTTWSYDLETTVDYYNDTTGSNNTVYDAEPPIWIESGSGMLSAATWLYCGLALALWNYYISRVNM